MTPPYPNNASAANAGVLICGCTSLLGRSLAKACDEAGVRWIGTSRQPGPLAANVRHLDLAQPSGWELPGDCRVAILCAGETRVDKCEADPVGTRQINVTNTVLLAKCLLERGVAIIFPTTSLDGASTEYGRQKAETVRQLQALSPRVAIVQLSKVIHGEFPLFQRWYASLLKGEVIAPFDNYSFSPVLLSYVTTELLGLLQHFRPGMWLLAGDRSISYAEAALLLARAKGLPEQLVQPVSRPGSSGPIPVEKSASYTVLPGRTLPSVENTLHSLFLNMHAPSDRLLTCHICSSTDVNLHTEYSAMQRITSDSKIWASGGLLFTCKACGAVQASCDKEWQKEIEAIYKSYSIYYQSGGEEQKVFDSESGQTLPRSEWLLRRVRDAAPLPQSGHLLDIGCGNGRFIKAFGRLYPDWKLSGTEFDDKDKATITALPGFDTLYTGRLEEVPGTFNLISLIHVLEHIENPLPFLKQIRSMLAPDGFLLVELPSYQDNPFELLIADHATHFSVETAAALLQKAGFNVVVATKSWVTKELSLLANLDASGSAAASTTTEGEGAATAGETVTWLSEIVRQATEMAAKSRSWGIFGTSIAGTWVTGQLSQKPAFYVDEDTNRIGQLHNGVPIVSPAQVPPDSDVYVAQPTPIAAKIIRRLGGGTVRYHGPCNV
ncbi:hypothetical protein DB346_04430 [Verrucomicrobia bacterium LW23]|nr:hypothetical protein DB346_04430 [Verrucomicrobia bacterium LW23]